MKNVRRNGVSRELAMPRSSLSNITNKTNGNKHNMEIEGEKGCALTTAQRYNYSCLKDVRAASEKLKAR